MGFQSDIYLGWAGKRRIVEALGEELYEAHRREETPHLGEIGGIGEAVTEYLARKYGRERLRFGRLGLRLYEMLEFESEGRDVGEDYYVFGIQLTGRYFPSFLDFEQEHGGLYIKRMYDRDLVEDVEWFRSFLIGKGLTRYETAEVFVKDNWY